MAKLVIEIVGNTGNVIREINNVSNSVEQLGEEQQKVAKTDEQKWKEAYERSKKKKAWLEEQKRLEAEAAAANGQQMGVLRRMWTSMDEHVRRVQGGWTNLNSKIQAVTGVIGAGVGFLTGTLDKIKEVVQEYEKLNNQMTILQSQKGSGEIVLQLERLDEVTNGVVGKFDLLESVNKATSFGIDLTRGNLEKLVGVASKASATMGTTLKESFDSLIVGTARESMMILDNLGVMVDVTKANEDYAKSLGKSKEELTDVESKTALLNQVLERLGRTQSNIVDEELLSSASGTFNRISRAWQSVKLEVGKYASEFLQWIDDLGRSEEQIDRQKYKNMLGDVRDYYERKSALAKQDLDDETKKYLETHQLMTAEQKADYIRDQNKKRIQIDDQNQEDRITENKASNLNKRIADELVAQGQVVNLWLDQERQRQMILEQGIEDETFKENYRMLSNQGIHKMYIEEIKKGLNDSQKALLDYYESKGYMIDADFLLFKNRTLDGIDFALKSLKSFAEQASKEAISGKWGKSAIQAIFGLDAKDFAKMQEVTGMKGFWTELLKNKTKSDKDIDKANKDADKQDEKIANEKWGRLEKQYKDKIQLAIESQKTINTFMTSDSVEVNDDFFTTDDNMKRIQDQQSMLLDIDKNISDRRLEIKKREKEILLEQERQYQETAKSYLFEAANNMYDGLISSRENFLQETIALSMQRAGAEIFNDGLQGLWQGGRWALSPYPTMAAQGTAMIGYSLAEIGAGIALGYAGKKLMPNTGGGSKDRTKDEASKDKSSTMKDTSATANVVTYLFPDERKWLQQLQQSNTKLNG